MNNNISAKKALMCAACFMASISPSVTVAAVDVDAAKALARKNSCFVCHSVDKEKDGPTFMKIAAKYRSKADAEAKLAQHMTSGEKAKFPDGHEEDHKIINTKDKGEIKNLVNWILAQ